MCIDATGSMSQTLNAVKTNASNFEANLNAELTKRGVRKFDLMRVRVIYYRDYGGNSNVKGAKMTVVDPSTGKSKIHHDGRSNVLELCRRPAAPQGVQLLPASVAEGRLPDLRQS